MDSSSMAGSSSDSSFKARVEKIFGSLPLSNSKSSPWSLTDEEVEKRVWRRDKGEANNRDDETPCSSSFDGLFKINQRRRRRNNFPSTTREDLQDDPEHPFNDDEDDVDVDVDVDGIDEWEIRSSIGLDCTLDNEEEEDEFDKLAEGREKDGDRLYMKDVTDHGPYLNSHNVLPSSIHVVPRDPRANRYAAKIRLKEDEVAAAAKLDSDQTCDIPMSDSDEDPHIMASEDNVKPKSILKRKENATTGKSAKQVKFDPACKDDNSEEASEKNNGSLTASVNDFSLAENAPRVPDYGMNPLKYVRYNFDSTSDIDEKSIMLEQKLDDASLDDASSVDTPKSVTFIPRKKTNEAKVVICSSEVKQNHGDGSKQSSTQSSFALGIAAGEVQQNEVGLKEEDELDSASIIAGFKKPSRHYRNKSSEEDTVS